MSEMQQPQDGKTNILDDALSRCRTVLWYLFAFSFAANLLMLAMPIYSLQVLDRVLSSGSTDTLLLLTIITLAMFVILGLITAARSFAMIRIGEWLDEQLAPKLMNLTLETAAQRGNVVSGAQNQRDLSTIKQFITGPPLSTMMDVPWTPMFILVIFLIHPIQGFIALLGVFILLALAVLNEMIVSRTLNMANENSVRTLGVAEIATRNAEVVEAMGMTNSVVGSWHKHNKDVSALQMLASNRSNVIMSLTKVFRLSIQILVLGVGAYLALMNEITAGAIIACSILIGRALGPFEAAIATWKALTDARKSYDRLKGNIDKAPERNEGILLPEPKGALLVERLVYAPHGSNKPILKGLTFGVGAGDVLGVIGASASGKTTLAKLLVGVWRPVSGNVRLDGADVYSWNREQFGKYVGYLPQDVELFDGTVKDNIGRLQEGVTDEQVVEAAKAAGAHEMILRLNDGYNTQIGLGGTNLSGGQRQRIALARVFFGTPRFIVLDEPNANLDSSGEQALIGAINNAKRRNITTIIISHRPGILNSVDKIMVLNDGQVEDFGTAAEVAAKFAARNKQVEGGAQPSQQIEGGPQQPAGQSNG